MIILTIILGIISSCSIIIFGVDFWYYLADRYCRYHIGRWNSEKDWINAVRKVCIKWMKKTPTVKITDNSKLILLDMINGKYRDISIQAWQNAALILGMLNDNQSDKAVESAKSFIKTDGSWKVKPKNIDSGMLAYSIMMAVGDKQSIKPAMDYMYNIMKNGLDNSGLLSYRGSGVGTDRYVDTTGLACPFLMLYGATYGVEESCKAAYNNISFYHAHGLMKEAPYLPNHAINKNTYIPLGIYGWGRGVAWYMIGIADSYICAPDKYKNDLKSMMIEALDNYAEFQREDGGFGSIIQKKDTYDSSATAVLSYMYILGYKITGKELYKTISDKCIEKLCSVTRITGKIDYCQGDAKAIGVASQTYDIMPFAQGFAMRTVSER